MFNSSSKKFVITALYIIGLTMAYPIISYYLETWRIVEELPLLPEQLYIQIFLSAPVLLIIGLLFFFKYKHRVVGL
jgi:hypothetical protein